MTCLHISCQDTYNGFLMHGYKLSNVLSICCFYYHSGKEFALLLQLKAINSPLIAGNFITPHSYLIFASSKAVTFHSTHITIARVMKLSYCRGAPDMIKHRRHSATQRCYHITCHVPLEPHGTHLRHC